MQEQQRRVLIFRKSEVIHNYYSRSLVGVLEVFLFTVIAAQIFVFFPIDTIQLGQLFDRLTLLGKDELSTNEYNYWIALPGLVSLYLLIFVYHFKLGRYVPETQFNKIFGLLLLILYAVSIGIIFKYSYTWLLLASLVLTGYMFRTYLMAINFKRHLENSVEPLDQAKLVQEIELNQQEIFDKYSEGVDFSEAAKKNENDRIKLINLSQSVMTINYDELKTWTDNTNQKEHEERVNRFIRQSSLFERLGDPEDNIATSGRWRRNMFFGAIASLIGGMIDTFCQLIITYNVNIPWIPIDTCKIIQYTIHGATSVFLISIILCGGVSKLFRSDYSIFSNIDKITNAFAEWNATIIVKLIISFIFLYAFLSLYDFLIKVITWYEIVGIVAVLLFIILLIHSVILGIPRNTLYEGHVFKYAQDIDDFCVDYVFAVRLWI
jgi:hypothetical protein